MQSMEETQKRFEQVRMVFGVGLLMVILHILGYAAAGLSFFFLFGRGDVVGAGTFAIASVLSFGFILNAYTR